MAKKKRSFNAFSLSFLDIMSCGLGAAVLIFLLLKNISINPDVQQDPMTQAEIDRLEEEITEGELKLARIRNTISDISDETVTAQGLARQIQDEIDKLKSELEVLNPDSKLERDDLESRLAKLESQKEALQNTVPAGAKAYEFSGDGQRQYLTGLRMSGRNVLILVDSSASMLDTTIVNIVRRRNLPDELKRTAPKWERTRAIAQWVVANLPLSSDFQLWSFNQDVSGVIEPEKNKWYRVNDRVAVAKAVQKLDEVLPANGTNLDAVLKEAVKMTPPPDNIFLITDGLPTLGTGSQPTGSVDGRQRLRLFYQALENLERGIAVNTILLPLEGDPYAAGSYWFLAQRTRGSFLTPARDWP